MSQVTFILLADQSIKMFIRGRPITMYIPSNILNYEELKMDLPSQKLDLDWVYPRTIVLSLSFFNIYFLLMCYI